MRRVLLAVAIAFATTSSPAAAEAQTGGFARLPSDVLDVTPPSARVRGLPGDISVRAAACRELPTADTRRRIVDIAIQEWGFFGFRVAAPRDMDGDDPALGAAAVSVDADAPQQAFARDLPRWRRSRLSPEEAARVAPSIAGYWAVTPEGPWIVSRQNERWNGPDGIAARWNAPWSAAFISWVMCEAGLGREAQFRRAIAHHRYIDQAIRARDGRAPQAAFVAYDVGETAIDPGDLLCASRRPPYRNLAERRRHLDAGARSHCDIVVKVDHVLDRVLAIGGNVRGVVSLKWFPGSRAPRIPPRPGGDDDERPMFAHLKLRAAPIGTDAFDRSPTVAAAGCSLPMVVPARGEPPLFASAASGAGSC